MTKDLQVMLGDPKKAILSMTLPIAFSILLSSVNSFADLAWCAWLGSTALSVVGLMNTLYLLIAGIGNGIGIGASIAISRHLGRKDYVGANKRAAQAFSLAILSSIIVSLILLIFRVPLLSAMGAGPIMDDCMAYALPFFGLAIVLLMNGVISGFLRSEGAAKKSMGMLAMAAILNIILDPIFMYILHMGVVGSAWATVVAMAISDIIGLLWYVRGRMIVKIKLRDLKIDREAMGDVLYVSVPQTIELSVVSIMNIVLNWFVITCGGTDGLAVYNTTWEFVLLAVIPAYAISAAMISVCSAALSNNDYDKARVAYWFSLKITVAVMITCSVFLAVFAQYAVHIFTFTAETSHLRPEMMQALRIYCIIIPFFGIMQLGSSLFQALRSPKKSLICSFACVMLITALYTYAFTVSMDAIYWSLCIGEVVGGVMMFSWSLLSFRMEERHYISSKAAVAKLQI
ncbi:MAG: MATE family efflux transporter [Candidatus Methanomethylophilaceae archaeon]